jgi:hypothetical protein
MGKLRKQTEEIMLKKLIFFITPSGIFPPAWEKRYIGNFIHNISYSPLTTEIKCVSLPPFFQGMRHSAILKI